jgi:hypothetical protein
VPHESRQQFPHPEIIDRGPEEYRRLLRRAVAIQIEIRARSPYQIHFIDEGRIAVPQEFASRVAREPVDRLMAAHPALFDRYVKVNLVFEQMIDAEQIAAHADRPGQRRALDLQHALDLVEQLDRRPAVAIQLVDERHDRRVA